MIDKGLNFARLIAENTRLMVRASEHATYRAIAPRAANQRAESIREKASRRVALRENVALRRSVRRFEAGIEGGRSVEDRHDATEFLGFSQSRIRGATPSFRPPPDSRRAGKARRSSSYLSHDAAVSLFLSCRRRISLLLLFLFTFVSLRERYERTNQRTHAPRSVATAVGAGRCLQSNCGGSSTVAPPKDAATTAATTTTTTTTTAFDRPPPFFCPSRRVRY